MFPWQVAYVCSAAIPLLSPRQLSHQMEQPLHRRAKTRHCVFGMWPLESSSASWICLRATILLYVTIQLADYLRASASELPPSGRSSTLDPCHRVSNASDLYVRAVWQARELSDSSAEPWYSSPTGMPILGAAFVPNQPVLVVGCVDDHSCGANIERDR